MDRDRFIHLVQDRAGIDDPAQAEELSRAVLTSLHARLGSEADHLGAQLPEGLREWYDEGFQNGNGSPRPRRVERYGWDGLCERVADAAGVDRSQAERSARAVFSTLQEQVTHGEASHVAAQLPEDIEREWTAAGQAGEPADAVATVTYGTALVVVDEGSSGGAPMGRGPLVRWGLGAVALGGVALGLVARRSRRRAAELRRPVSRRARRRR